MTPHSRRNSITSVSTANTYTSQQMPHINKSLSRDMSTDNLISVDSKFIKKPTKKVAGGLSPQIAPHDSFSKSNSITSATSYTSYASHNSYTSNASNINHNYQQSSIINNNSNNAVANSSFRNQGPSANSYYTKEGVYYFPNGEVFRPRTAPTKRNRPGKIIVDTSSTRQNNNINNNNNSNNNSNNNNNYQGMSQGYHPNQTHYSPSMGPHMNQPRFANESPSSSPAIAAPPTLRSAGSYTSLPKSNSLQNVRLANKQNLSKTIRDNRGDIHTNITIDNNNNKMPYENYKNNSASSLKNLHKLHSQNITKSEQHYSSNASSSISSSSSNMSNVLQNQYHNNSTTHLDRSDSNTPSTSISDDHIHAKHYHPQNQFNHSVENSGEAELTSNADNVGGGFHEHTGEPTLHQNHEDSSRVESNKPLDQGRSTKQDTSSYASAEQNGAAANANNDTNRESSGSSDQRLSMDSVSDGSGNRRDDDDATDDTVLSTLNANSEDTFKTATAVSTLRSNSAGHSLSSIGDNLHRHAVHDYPTSSHSDNLHKAYSDQPLRHSSSSISDVSIDDKDSLDETPILTAPITSPIVPQSDMSRHRNDTTKACEAPEKPVLANISDMSFNSTQEDLSKPYAENPEAKETALVFSSHRDEPEQGTTSISVPINCSVLEKKAEDVPDLKPPRQVASVRKTSSGDPPSDESFLPEPSIDNGSFVDDYSNNASPESYKLNELIEAHNEPSPSEVNQIKEGQGSVKNQTISVPQSADKLNQQVLSPSYSFSSVQSADYEITCKSFNGLVNDNQEAVPPRGDVQIGEKKIRKHHRHASSTSSAEFISQLKQEASKPVSNDSNTTANPSTPKAEGQRVSDEIETPPYDAVPPPPIDKSPGMKVKGKPKKHKHHHHHHHHHQRHDNHHNMQQENGDSRKSSNVKVGSALKEEVVLTPQSNNFPKVGSLLTSDTAIHSASKDEPAKTSKPSLVLNDSVFNKPAPSFQSTKQFHSPQQSQHAPLESPKASLFSFNTSISSTSPSKLPKSSSISNFKSFFKKLKPKEKDANVSTSNVSLNSGASASPSKKKLNRGLFGFSKFKKEETTPPPTAASKLESNNDANISRLSVLSEASFKLGALPDFEPEGDGLFDDVMLTFDEQFERDLTPTKPPDFVKLSQTASRNKNSNGLLSEPFLKDDELTKEQIADQQLRDNTENSGEDGSGASNDDEDDYGGEEQTNTGSDVTENNADTGTWTGTYIDENIEFLKNEGFWSQLDEAALAKQIELEKRSSGITQRPKEEHFTVSTPIQESMNEEGDTDASNGKPLTAPSDTSPNGTARVVVDNHELNYIFSNLTEEGKRNLPLHLKYIKQFRDYSTVEVEMRKFQAVLEDKPKTIQPLNKPSILKRRQYKFNSPYDQHQQQLQKSVSFPQQSNNKRVNFNNKILINETFSSDAYKRYNKSVTQYSLSDSKEISNIKNEVNYYKCNEMLVHESSQNNTHFYY
ncbi:hypothetical protein CANMA_004334 [Candida margitis]|uniref:uncharacterized protein n=1 Tax=Candida margitis TaxID=1775924 RepID=UPI0022273D3A|nr:uncharacterized protein CANMA_004334 [Candida margitis]KAI5957902.1 hypothetical protein CANMA_004334 [Candida margitis]